MPPASQASSPPVILIVEDDSALLELLRMRLERAGFAVASAATGEEAIQWLGENQARLMVLDYQLSDLRGEEAIARLEEKKLLPPFVVVTGQGSEEVAVQMMKLGARDYLVKNSRLLEVFPEVVKRVVKQIDQEARLVQAENSLRQSEYEHRTILESLPAGVLKISPTGELLYANAEARRFFRFGDKPLSSRLVSNFQRNSVNEDFSGCPMRNHPLAVCLATGKPQPAVTLGVRFPDGWVNWAIYAATPIVDGSNDRLSAVVLSLVDVTHRRQAEEALRQTFNDTESRLNGQMNRLQMVERKLKEEQTFSTLLKETIETERQFRRRFLGVEAPAAPVPEEPTIAPLEMPEPAPRDPSRAEETMHIDGSLSTLEGLAATAGLPHSAEETMSSLSATVATAANPVFSPVGLTARSSMEGLGLVKTLEWLVTHCRTRTNCVIKFDEPSEFDAPCANTEAVILDFAERLLAQAPLEPLEAVELMLGRTNEKIRLGFRVKRRADAPEPVVFLAVEELRLRAERLGGDIQSINKSANGQLVLLELGLGPWSPDQLAARSQPGGGRDYAN